jgi:anti-anti-sigma factor
MSEALELTAGFVGGVPMVRLRGPLVFGRDLHALAALFTTLSADGSHRVIVIDLSGVPSIDSSGLAALLELKKTIGRDRLQIMLLKPVPQVRKALRSTRIDSLFEVFADDTELLVRLEAHESGGDTVIPT